MSAPVTDPSSFWTDARAMVDRCAAETVLTWRQALGCAVAGALLVVGCAWTSRRLRSAAIQRSLVAIAAASALGMAWQVKWAADDAFISFRYADNWVRGNGLVWNPGERVEGYTNFLWTALLAGAIRLGFDPVQAAVVFSLTCFALLLAVVMRLALRALPEEQRGLALLPLALTAANPYLVAFATSGLETMLVTLLVTLALERAWARRPVQAGAAAAAAMMAHPDQAILVMALALTLLLDTTLRRDGLRFSATVASIFGPYYVLRWSYYGEFWTNTYYAKSAGSSYFPQGFRYLVVALFSGGLWGVIPAAVTGVWKSAAELLRSYWVIGVPLFLAYVAKIGGDFMDGRLITSLLPTTFVLAALGVGASWSRAQSRRASRVPRGALALVLAALSTTACSHVAFLRSRDVLFAVANESSYYHLASFAPPVVESRYFAQATSLRDEFPQQSVRLAAGCVGMIGCYSRLPVLDRFGLNDKITARMPIAERGRPGHEKLARLPRLLEWGADLSVDPIYPEPYTELGRATIEGFPYYIVRYDAAAADRMSQRGHFAPEGFRAALEHLVDPDEAPRTPPEQASCHFWYVDTVYLSTVSDPALRERLSRFLRGADPGTGDRSELAFQASEPSRLGYRLTKTLSMESFVPDHAGSYVLAPGAMMPDQGSVWGERGPFIDTWRGARGDEEIVTLRSPRFRIEGDAITLSVGGGRSPSDTFVGLQIDGRWARRSSGCDVEVLGRRVWDVSPFRGRDAEIVIVDNAKGGWGHVLVSDVAEWTSGASL
jgi:hypothetical protein